MSIEQALEALHNGEQCDADGVMIKVSREALFEVLAYVDKAEFDILALCKDRNRIDWLSNLDVAISHKSYGTYRFYASPDMGSRDIREVVDAAMEEERLGREEYDAKN